MTQLYLLQTELKLQQISSFKSVQNQPTAQDAVFIEPTRNKCNEVRSIALLGAQRAAKPAERLYNAHQHSNENEVVLYVNSGRKPLQKKPNQTQMQY